MHKGSKTHKKKNKKLGKPKKHKNETILRDSCLDPPKSEKNKKNKKNLGKPKKQKIPPKKKTILRDKTSPQLFCLFFFFWGGSQQFFFLILEGPAKSL